LVSKQAFRAPEGTYVPLRPVAEALCLGVWWDEAASCPVVAGRPVAALVIEGRSYVEAATLAELLGDSRCVLVTPDGVFITR
ncbi:MAG: copper amine oxidase N-terminal domain-containing protein, partial [Firmicutes bacterium]|nr:copper amine oxidase N-terminal domain-containing protein [Bacillota bacterium]